MSVSNDRETPRSHALELSRTQPSQQGCDCEFQALLLILNRLIEQSNCIIESLEWGCPKNAAASDWTKILSMRLNCSASMHYLPHHVWRPNHLSSCRPWQALDQAQTDEPNSRSRKDYSLGWFSLELDPQLPVLVDSFDHHGQRKTPRFLGVGVQNMFSRALLMQLTAPIVHERFHCS